VNAGAINNNSKLKFGVFEVENEKSFFDMSDSKYPDRFLPYSKYSVANRSSSVLNKSGRINLAL
jgi:hypothetical protein